jgi:hypothetical protein
VVGEKKGSEGIKKDKWDGRGTMAEEDLDVL